MTVTPLLIPIWPEISIASTASTATSVCNDGTIIAESAVPGAYQQICMTLEQRQIPLLRSSHTTTTTTTTPLYIQQGQVASGQTGVAVWNAALLLVRLLDAITQLDSSWLHDKTIMELGCGTGVASIALNKLGASRVLCTDGNPNVLELARTNMELNHIHVDSNNNSNVQVVQLPWGFLNAMDYSDVADIVIGSDLTYNSGTWRVLAETLVTVLKPGGFVVYVSLGHAGFNVNSELNGFLQVINDDELRLVSDTSHLLPVAQLQTLLDEIVLTPEEKSVLDATGGARVVVLQKRKEKRNQSSGAGQAGYS
jgi:SAM-dependent methyltransferase